MDHLDRGDAHTLDARDLRGREGQLAEVETALRVSVVADADTRHHHLTLILRDALLDLVQYGRGRARTGAATHGRDDAVGTVAVAAVLHLYKAARTVP